MNWHFYVLMFRSTNCLMCSHALALSRWQRNECLIALEKFQCGLLVTKCNMNQSQRTECIRWYETCKCWSIQSFHSGLSVRLSSAPNLRDVQRNESIARANYRYLIEMGCAYNLYCSSWINLNLRLYICLLNIHVIKRRNYCLPLLYEVAISSY